MEKIKIRGLTKIFGPSPAKALRLLSAGKSKDEVLEKTHHAVGVNQASFDVGAGEVVVVMGLSGSGKSTLLRCLNRLIEPTAGSIQIDGQEITSLSAKELRHLRQKSFGMVFQNFALFPHRSVVENVEYGLEIMGTDKSRRREKAMTVLERVGLAGWETSMPSKLSGGMQQRVGLARALALDPDILLMDEAFSALDPLIRSDMQDELLRLQEELQKTIVFISHDLDEALKIGDRIVLMRDGQVVQIGTPEDILTSPADEYVARFVADVDMAKVLTAETVMKRSEAVAFLGIDGPRTALRKMRHHAIASLFVLDRSKKILGLISAKDTAALVERKGSDLTSILQKDFSTVALDTPASELIPLVADLSHPLAVVDGQEKLRGVIVRGLLLGALAERGGNIDE